MPSTDDQKGFDEVVLGLTKVLVDSLNEKALNALIRESDSSEIKGSISRLEVAFRECGVQRFEDFITFLRRLQELRSSGAAHRKGEKYRKIAANFGVEKQSLRGVMEEILVQATCLLQFLTEVVRSGGFQNDDSSKQEIR